MNEDISVRDYLISLGNADNLNFTGLVDLIDKENIPIKAYKFPPPYSRAFAATNPISIILNLNEIRYVSLVNQYHIILHEIGHYLRIRKIGVDAIDSLVGAITVYEDFLNHLIEEERFAEKYATMTFYKLNGRIDDSPMQLDMNAIGKYMGYAKFMFDDLTKSGLTFFEYCKTKLNFE
jgi:hypothetical protein